MTKSRLYNGDSSCSVFSMSVLTTIEPYFVVPCKSCLNCAVLHHTGILPYPPLSSNNRQKNVCSNNSKRKHASCKRRRRLSFMGTVVEKFVPSLETHHN